MTCILTYCTNATGAPLNDDRQYGYIKKTNNHNYNVATGERVGIGGYLSYLCKTNTYYPDDVDTKESAARSVKVYCKDNGEFQYPNPWVPCVSNVQCIDPGITDILERSEVVGNNLTYNSQLEFKCKDKR